MGLIINATEFKENMGLYIDKITSFLVVANERSPKKTFVVFDTDYLKQISLSSCDEKLFDIGVDVAAAVSDIEAKVSKRQQRVRYTQEEKKNAEGSN